MRLAAAAGAVVALLVIGRVAGPCREGAGQDPTSARGGVGPLAGATPPSTTISPDLSPVSPEQDVETAYLAFAGMGARLLQAPDPDDPEIARRASGEARGDLVDGLTTLRASQRRYELGPRYEHRVRGVDVDVAGTTATADVCVIDDARLLDTSTHEVVAEGLTTVSWTVTLLRQAHTWRVDEIVEGDVVEGTAGCDA